MYIFPEREKRRTDAEGAAVTLHRQPKKTNTTMEPEKPSHKPPEETEEALKNDEPAPAEESIPVASAIFFGEPQPDFWDENFF